ncbi:MAG: guanylate kinase [Coriobacteriales bacterium]|jgi:guanylate kinase|nr:guanylate kinase [Coriobacteriales bacterium]
MSGNLFVISGPSGAGKGTLVERAFGVLDELWLSVSATTRKPRPDELEGVHYFFLGDDQFDALLAEDGFLEWAPVHGQRYGTLRTEVESRLARGIDVVLEIDPQGAFQVREKLPRAQLIFIEPPSLRELERRLIIRATETAEAIARRLRTAEVELAAKERYNVVITNDDLETATSELVEFITQHRLTKTV